MVKVTQGKVGIKGYIVFILILAQLICFYPYEFNSVYFINLPQGGGIMHMICIIFTIVLLLLLGLKMRFKQTVFLLIIIQFAGYLICNTINNNFNLTVGILLVYILCALMLLLSNSTIGIVNFFKLYNRWIFFMAALGTVTWFLVNFSGYSAIYSSIDFQNTDRLIDNYILTFANHNNDTSKFTYAGFFDENGAMGLWGLFALLTNKVFIKEKWLEIPLIVCLLLTFSMGFYIQLFLYLTFFYVNKSNIGKAFVFIIAGVLLIMLVSSLKNTELDFVYEKSIGRFTEILNSLENNNSIASIDNRNYISQNAISEFKKHPFWGTSNDKIEVGDNIYEPLALYGIIGTLIIYFPFIWLLLHAIIKKETIILKSAIIIVASFFHRPFHSHIIWLIQLYGFIWMYLESRKIQNK